MISEEVTEQSFISSEQNSTTTEKSELKTNLGRQYQYKFDFHFYRLSYN